ncbi:MAG: hypothetical protein IT424_07630 [Pirellulales bacterium]|nr:hypothetical protein [Pirellulales bacterium]
MPPEPTSADAPPKRGPSAKTLLKGAACVSVIVLLEAGAALALLPTAEDTQRTAQQLADAAHGELQKEGDPPSGGAPPAAENAHDAEVLPETHEASLGSYHVVSFNPSTGTSTAIDFELFGVVHADDEAEFAERYLVHEKRLNEQVTIAIRSMQPSDFSDPGLGLIKRVILEKVNRALGKSLVREAIFSDFAFMER